MLAKQEPQLEWRFLDEEGADDAAWQGARLTSAGRAHGTAQPYGASKQPWPTRGWLELLLLAALVATLLWVWPWQSGGETGTDGSIELKVGQHKEVAPPLAQSKLLGGHQMDPVEQHCSQLPPDAMPSACHTLNRAKTAGSRPMDAIEHPCSQLLPDSVPNACQSPLSAYGKADSSRQLDAIKPRCYQLPPDFALRYCDVP